MHHELQNWGGAGTSTCNTVSMTLGVTMQTLGDLEWSEDFTQGQPADAALCESFNAMRALIPSSGVQSVTLYSSNGVTATCVDNAQAVASALSSASEGTLEGAYTCDGVQWHVGPCGGTTEFDAEICAGCSSVCSCSGLTANSVTIRPCIGNSVSALHHVFS